MNIPRGGRTHRKMTAYHEAGHALALLHEGRQVRGIFLSPTHPENGTCLSGARKKNPYDVMKNKGSAKAAWIKTQQSTYADIRIALAGPLAEAKIIGKPLRALGSKSDLDSCIYQVERLARLRSFMAGYIKVKPLNPEQIFEAEKRRTSRWLRRPEIWAAVSLVAFVLFHKGRMSGPALNNIIGAAGALKGQMNLNFGLGRLND